MVCLVLGDSIAVGTQQALIVQHLVCERQARVGISSSKINEYPVIDKAGVVIISAGSNDDPKQDNSSMYELIRQKYVGKRVIWILPRNRTIAHQVMKVVQKYKDSFVDGLAYKSLDNTHPTNYIGMAKAVKAKI